MLFRSVATSVPIRLIGPEYALLRPAFAAARLRRGVREKVARIAIFMSGTDPDGTTMLALSALSQDDLATVPLDIAIGSGSPHCAAIREAAKSHPRAAMHVDLPDLADLFAAADLSIGSGGVAALERCCVGLPTVTLTLAANQEPALAELSRLGAVNRKSTRLNSSHIPLSRMPSSA